jgi:hypothetical protein
MVGARSKWSFVVAGLLLLLLLLAAPVMGVEKMPPPDFAEIVAALREGGM